MSEAYNRGGFPKKGGSQFDSQQTLKLGFDDNLQSHRFHDSESPVYDRFETTLDINDNITQIIYYVAENHEKFELGVTDASALNDKYFVISSPYDRVQLYIWFNVDGAGNDPSLPNSIGIEVPLESTDTIAMVATGIMIFLRGNSTFNYLFEVTKQNGVLVFYTKKEGPVTTNSIGTTSFVLSTITEGSERISDIYSFSYDSSCNITGMYKV